MPNSQGHVYQDISGLSSVVKVTIIIRFLVALAVSLLTIAVLYLVDENGPDDETATSLAIILVLGALGGVIMLLVNFILFLVWVNRACKNAHALSTEVSMPYTSGWSVGWYFVPFANLIMPAKVMASIWNHSDPDISKEGDKTMARTVSLWWGLWIFTSIAENISNRLIESGEMSNAVSQLMTVGVLLMEIAFTIYWLKLVTSVTQMQQQKSTRVDEYTLRCEGCGEAISDRTQTHCELCGEPLPQRARSNSGSEFLR